MLNHFRVSRWHLFLAVSAVHILLFILLSQHKSEPKKPQAQNAIQIVMVKPPSEVVAVEKPPVAAIPKLINRTEEKTPARKPFSKTGQDPSKKNTNNRDESTTKAVKNNRYGAFLVRPQTGRISAFGRFYHGFNCVRLTSDFSRRNCSSRQINLMQGYEVKIAAVSAMMERRGIGRGGSGQLHRIDRAAQGSTQPLSTNTSVGAPIIGENFGRLPPKHSDPGFGD